MTKTELIRRRPDDGRDIEELVMSAMVERRSHIKVNGSRCQLNQRDFQSMAARLMSKANAIVRKAGDPPTFTHVTLTTHAGRVEIEPSDDDLGSGEIRFRWARTT